MKGADGGGGDGALDAIEGAGVVAEDGENGLDFAGPQWSSPWGWV